MKPKPPFENGYSPELLDLVQSVLLYVCTKIGDFALDYIVAGGLVPILIIPQDPPPEGAEKHVGTRDLDLGLSLAIFEGSRYQAIAERLRSAGFAPDISEAGNPTFQRWRLGEAIEATVDFLIPQTSTDEFGGQIKHLEDDFGAVITPGLELAFQDRISVTLSGRTPFGEMAKRDVWVCGPGAYTILKALAFNNRGENKDAYDLYYVVRNYGSGAVDVARHLEPLLKTRPGREALEILKRDFENASAVGPTRVARFLFGEPDEETRADAAGFINQLLGEV
jgi:hypothetical protein